MFEPWQLAMIDDAGYNGIRDEHVEAVANSMLSCGLTEFDSDAFEYHCHKCGIDPDCFTREDIERVIEELTNR